MCSVYNTHLHVIAINVLCGVSEQMIHDVAFWVQYLYHWCTRLVVCQAQRRWALKGDKGGLILTYDGIASGENNDFVKVHKLHQELVQARSFLELPSRGTL